MEGGPPGFPKEFAVSHGTQEHPGWFLNFAYTALTFSGNLFHGFLLFANHHLKESYNPQPLPASSFNIIYAKNQKWLGLGSTRFARRLLRVSTSISFPHLTKIFQFWWFPPRCFAANSKTKCQKLKPQTKT